MLDQENITTYVPKIKLRSNSIEIKHKPSETCPDCFAEEIQDIGQELEKGRYVATENSSARSLGLYVATELFQNVDTTLVHVFSSALRCYLPKTVANPFHVSRHSKSSIKLYGKNRRKFTLYRKKP
ncbi:hypothetical protein F2Q69_00048841 [Brassica cretica]|uniref:Uncharacterized protein n=1 Tax=Brassica cretica TaxID=69181 RepID=A0A8S9Q2S5_BRACR|nr:hypothetical protein F2Q69_00048841 [Brassica cretica]